MAVAIIPARGGSKRIPKKNIKDFFGAPLISYSIKAAQESGIFDSIWVSTDDAEIKAVALELGAEVLDRPAKLSDDFTGTTPVIVHSIKELNLKDTDEVACIYATAPLLEAKTLIEAGQLLQKNPSRQIFVASAYSSPPQRAFMLDKDGLAFHLAPENQLKRSQDLEKIYFDAGVFYFATVATWRKQNPFLQPIILADTQVQDIDSISDWRLAELKYQLLQETKQKRDSLKNKS